MDKEQIQQHVEKVGMELSNANNLTGYARIAAITSIEFQAQEWLQQSLSIIEHQQMEIERISKEHAAMKWALENISEYRDYFIGEDAEQYELAEALPQLEDKARYVLSTLSPIKEVSTDVQDDR